MARPSETRPDGMTGGGRVAALDGVRGIAILTVVAYHAIPAHVPFGSVGVVVFFVLSGYLISSIMLKERLTRGRFDYAAFYVRRALRLFPALVVAIVGGALLMLIVRDPQLTTTYPLEALAAILYVGDITQPLGMAMPVLGHTWSLAVEEQFYLVWPLLLMLLVRWSRGDRKRLLTYVFLLATVGLVWHLLVLATTGDWMRAYFPPDVNAYALLAGAALGVSGRRLLLAPWVAWASTIAILLLSVVPLHSETDAGRKLQVVAGTVAAGLALLLISSAPNAGRLLANAPLTWIGRVSYGWYLWHQVLWHVHVGGTLVLPHPLAAVLALIPTALSFYFVERPILRWKRRFERVNEPAAIEAPATA